MATTAVLEKPSTREKILDLAQDLIMRFGYNGFSYADISKQLKIKNAAIHYHFPIKADLVKAAVEQYVENFRNRLQEIDNNQAMSAAAKFDAYLAPFVQLSDSGIKICLCGVLAGEVLSLPKKVRQETQKFFSIHEMWLAQFLEMGEKRKALQYDGAAQASARLIFSTLQGALLAARLHQDAGYYHDVVNGLKRHLKLRG